MAALTFDIIGKDHASATFAKVGRSAQTLGNTLESTSSRGSRTFSRMGHAASTFGRTLGKVAKAGAVGGALIGAGMVAASPNVLSMAASIELMGRKAATVFGTQLGRVKAWARENATAMGLSSREATGLAGNFADLLIPMGFARKEAASMATDVIGLSGALAEWSGGSRTAAEVSESLAKAMLGEREELRGLGIAISEADVQQRLLMKGQAGLTGATLAQAEALATQELIMEKSKDAQAAYAKGSGTLARALAESKAQLKTFAETMLVAVTPLFKSFAGWLTDTAMPALLRFSDWFSGPGKFVVAGWFLEAAQAALKFAGFMHGVFSNMTEMFLGFGKNMLAVADQVFGWMPVIGDKVKTARAQFASFAEGVSVTMDAAGAKIKQWNNTVAGMRNEVELKANIADLQAKLATARKELRDPNLTRTREAHLRAEIRQLLDAKAQAQGALDSLRDKTVNVFIDLLYRKPSSGRGSLPLPLIDGFAHGTASAPRGFALVGEEGPELVTFRGGERVHTARQTAAMLAVAGNGGDVTRALAGSSAPRDFAKELVRELRQAGLTLLAVDSGKRADLLRRAG